MEGCNNPTLNATQKVFEEESNPLARKPSEEFKKVAEELGTSLSQVFVEYGIAEFTEFYFGARARKKEFMERMKRFGLKEEDVNLGKDCAIPCIFEKNIKEIIIP